MKKYLIDEGRDYPDTCDGYLVDEGHFDLEVGPGAALGVDEDY